MTLNYFVWTFVKNGYVLHFQHKLLIFIFLPAPPIGWGIYTMCQPLTGSGHSHFWGFTMAWMVVVLWLFMQGFLGMVSILRLERDAIALPSNSTSPFPLYQYDPKRPTDLVSHTDVLVKFFLGLFLLIIWGGPASLVLDTPYIGTVAISGGLVSILLVSLYVLNTPERLFEELLQEVSCDPDQLLTLILTLINWRYPVTRMNSARSWKVPQSRL